MHAYTVLEPFMRKNPVTGKFEMHNKGDQITNPLRVSDLRGSDHEGHCVQTTVGDDHEHTGLNAEPQTTEDESE